MKWTSLEYNVLDTDQSNLQGLMKDKERYRDMISDACFPIVWSQYISR